MAHRPPRRLSRAITYCMNRTAVSLTRIPSGKLLRMPSFLTAERRIRGDHFDPIAILDLPNRASKSVPLVKGWLIHSVKQEVHNTK